MRHIFCGTAVFFLSIAARAVAPSGPGQGPQAPGLLGFNLKAPGNMPLSRVVPLYADLLGITGESMAVVRNLTGAADQDQQRRILAEIEKQIKYLPPEIQTLEELDAYAAERENKNPSDPAIESWRLLSQRAHRVGALDSEENAPLSERLEKQRKRVRALAEALAALHRETRDPGFPDDDWALDALDKSEELQAWGLPYLDHSDTELMTNASAAHRYFQRESGRVRGRRIRPALEQASIPDLSRVRDAADFLMRFYKTHPTRERLAARPEPDLESARPSRALAEDELEEALNARRIFKVVHYEGPGEFRVGDFSYSVEHPADPALTLFGISQSGRLWMKKPGQNAAGIILGVRWKITEATTEKIIFLRGEQKGADLYFGRIEAVFTPGPLRTLRSLRVTLNENGQRSHLIELEEIRPADRLPEMGL